jgi:hypothetical protein
MQANRKPVEVFILICAANALTACTLVRTETKKSAARPVVLVHGAWMGASSRDKVANG